MGPVANLRFTQSYLEAMSNVEAIGRDSRLLPMEMGAACRVPALKIRGWNFTDAAPNILSLDSVVSLTAKTSFNSSVLQRVIMDTP